MKVAVYPGSFDPVTNGHLNLIRRALSIFDRVIVAVAFNIRKTGFFTVEERVRMLKDATKGMRGIEIDSFDGLLVDYVQSKGARVVIRGLRAVSDFEYEFQMAHMNHKLRAEVETVFLVTGADEFFISSNVVREVATLGGSIKCLVPEIVRDAVQRKLADPMIAKPALRGSRSRPTARKTPS
jgi:pantetheine-phosphate adenylyltransferase